MKKNDMNVTGELLGVLPVGGQTVKGQGDGNEYDQSILYACMRTEK
jgi:hypothetical protein